MSLSSSPIARTPPPAERSSQRSERAPTGDFAALLELAPTPARAPLGRAAERHGSDRGPGDAHGDRRDRPAPASPRSRHTRPDGGRPAATPGQHAPRLDHSAGRRPVVAEGATEGPTAAEAAAVPGVPAPADVFCSPEPAAPPYGLTGAVGAPAVEPPVTVALADPAVVLVAPGSAATPSSVPPPTTDPQALAPVLGAPGAPPFGAGAAAAGVPIAGAALSEAALADGVPATAASAPTAPVPAPVEAGAMPAGVPSASVVPATEAAAATVATAGAVTTHAEAGTPAGGESATSNLPAGTATGTGAGSGGARDGQTGGAPSPEVAEASSGVPAPTTTATALPPGFTRMPDAAAFGPHRSVPLERAPRAVAQLLHVASQQGVSHARIALRPVELGGIEIFLQVSPAGLAAQLVAESPEAARMLAQATEDLRRSLAGQNVELISLEVSTSAEQQQRDDLAARGFVADEHMPGGRPAPRRADGSSEPASAASDLTTPTVIELPDGLLVDVLA